MTKLRVYPLLLVSLLSISKADLPPGHDTLLLNDFIGTMRCPYAADWLQKGPEQAARDLGLTNGDEASHRKLDGPSDGAFGAPAGGSPPGGPPPGIWGSTPSGPTTCGLAPGPAGAAHQAAYSTGYDNCTGTPAEGSPYMWPVAWSALIESESMAFGSDTVGFTSKGQVWYRLDRNWKRADTFYQRGVQRSIGQGPCAPENVVSPPDQPVVACSRNSDRRTTMLHRGSKMYFITWKNETNGDAVENIDTCRWLDLAIVGNIRPDWYLDKRGEATDVQYLGKQHVYYHNSTPRLVKQWRKEDFADQYFTMSMQENVLEDGIHWPLILNVPGEGFGDDFLQKYTDHFMLTDDDDNLFLLDQALEAANGTCPQMNNGGGSAGPPVGEVDPIPSNLVVEQEAWFTNEVTFSPVWNPPLEVDSPIEVAGSFGRTVTDTDFGSVSSCYDRSSETVNLSFTFADITTDEPEELPWVALGYRPTEECLMTPRGGGDTELIFIGSSDLGISASRGILSPAVKRFDQSAFAGLLASLTPLADDEKYLTHDLVLPFDTRATKRNDPTVDALQLTFAQKMESPETINLMYAIGDSSTLGYHSSRGCFQITDFPDCPLEVAATEPPLGGTSSAGLVSVTVALVIIIAMSFP